MDKLYTLTEDAPVCVSDLADVPANVMLSVTDWGLLRKRFALPYFAPVWLVPSKPCPECATRRNLADSPGA